MNKFEFWEINIKHKNTNPFQYFKDFNPLQESMIVYKVVTG